MEVKVQVSIDAENLEEAMKIAQASVEGGADILEVGTPLLLGEGVHAIRAMVMSSKIWDDHRSLASSL